MGLQDLPTELILEILDLCRPDGFESSALTCKDVYTIAQKLLWNHQQCKHGIQNIRTLTGHEQLRIGDKTFSAFLWLASIPSHLRPDQLRYVKTISVRETYSSFENSPPSTCRNWLQRARAFHSAYPSSEAALSRLAQVRAYRTLHTSHRTNEATDSSWEDLNLLLVDMFWAATTLSVDLNNFRARKSHIAESLAEAISAIPNQGYLQNIRHIFFERSSLNGSVYMAGIGPFLTLPRLESIIVKQPFQRSSPPKISPELCRRNHTATTFIALEAPPNPSRFLSVIQMLPNLTSFVWQYCEKRAAREDPTCPGIQPVILLDLLVQAYGKQLEHLAIQVTNYRPRGLPPLIEDQNTIVHLQQFTSLTHLDIDFRVLRRRVENPMIATSPSIIRGPCLAQVLPPTIRQLAMTVDYTPIVASSLHDLLNQLTIDRDTHAYLESIYIHIRMETTDLGDEVRIQGGIGRLCEDFAKIKIAMEWRFISDYEDIKPGLGWDDGSKIFPREYGRF